MAGSESRYTRPMFQSHDWDSRVSNASTNGYDVRLDIIRLS